VREAYGELPNLENQWTLPAVFAGALRSPALFRGPTVLEV